MAGVTLLSLREQYPTLFYPQDWWLDDPFARIASRDVRLWVDPQTGLGRPGLPTATDRLPRAAEVAERFCTALTEHGKELWPYHYVWCADMDTVGDRIYVGGYRLGRVVGFQVHRHLTIRDQHMVIQAVP